MRSVRGISLVGHGPDEWSDEMKPGSITAPLGLLLLFGCPTGDGVPIDEACDDTDPDNFPGNPEICDEQVS